MAESEFDRGFREGVRTMDHPYRIAAVNAERERDEARAALCALLDAIDAVDDAAKEWGRTGSSAGTVAAVRAHAAARETGRRLCPAKTPQHESGED